MVQMNDKSLLPTQMTFTGQLGWFYQSLHLAVPVEPAMNYQLHISLTIVHWCLQPLKWLVSTRRIKNSFLSTLINYPWLWLKRKKVLIILISCLDLIFQLFCFCWRKTIGFIRDGLNEFKKKSTGKKVFRWKCICPVDPAAEGTILLFLQTKSNQCLSLP